METTYMEPLTQTTKGSAPILELLKPDNVSNTKLSSREISDIPNDVAYIYTWVVYTVTCQLVDVFGVITNIINIVCFVKQELKDSVNISLIALACSDIMCLITLIGINVGLNPSILTSDLPYDSMDITYLIFSTPHLTFSRVSSWITAMITLERCVCITAPLQVHNVITPRRTSVIIVGVFIVLVLSVAPVYVVNRLGMKFSPQRNKTIVGIVSLEGRERVEKLSFAVNNFGIPLAAFVIILVCTITLVSKLYSTSRWRTISFSTKQSDNVSNRNLKVAKMVTMISALFIACFVPVCAYMLALTFEPGLYLDGKYVNIAIVLAGIGFILESVNSSANIFIYYNMSSKYRNIFRRLFFGTQNNSVL